MPAGSREPNMRGLLAAALGRKWRSKLRRANLSERQFGVGGRTCRRAGKDASQGGALANSRGLLHCLLTRLRSGDS